MMRFGTKKWGVVLLLLLPSILLGSCRKDDQDKVLITGKSKSWLGVHVTGLSEKMLKNMDIDHGVKIVKVFQDSPAEAAGLEVDDIITQFNGHEVSDPEDLMDLVQDLAVDSEAELSYIREGNQKTAAVRIAERPDKGMHKIIRRPGKLRFSGEKSTWLGVETSSLNDQLRAYFGAPDDLGVLVKRVIEDSPAEKGGLQAGDVIIGVSDRKIRSARDLKRSIDYYDPEETVTVRIVRDKKEQSCAVRLGAKEPDFDFHFFGDGPDKIDLDITIPEIDIDTDVELKWDEQKLRELERKVGQELKTKTIELKDKLDALQEELGQKLKRVSVRQI